MPAGGPSAGAVGGFLVKQIGAALVTQGANQFIVPQVFDALGLGEADDGAKYAEMVIAEMKKIGQDLSRQIDQVQDSVNRVAALTIDIAVYQKQEGLAQILRTFNSEATKIETSFKLFTNDIKSLSATDDNKNRRALKDLYSRLNSPNDRDVSTAMKNIHNLFIPPTSVDRGIPDYLADIVGQAVFTAAPTLLNKVPNATANWRKDFVLPQDMDYIPAIQIMEGAPGPVNKELEAVLSVFRRVLTAQTKGLMFLTRAWMGGPQEQGLEEHIDDLVAEIAIMKAFFAKCVPEIDKSICKSLQQFAKPLTGEITRLPWLALRTLHNQKLWKDVPEGLNGKWVVWQVFSDGKVRSVHMAEEPWLRKKPMRGVAHVRVDGFRGEDASFISGEHYDFPMMMDWGTKFVSDIKYPGTQPDAMTNVLKTLPATKKELTDAAVISKW
jgi:hypothetical protein